MKKTISTIALCMFAMSATLLTSCQRDEEMLPSNQKVTVGNTNSACTPIIAGQNMTAGQICFDDVDTNNDGQPDQLNICYTTTGGWELTEAQLFIGTATSQIPMTKSGNPIPGQFPYQSGNIAGQTSYCFSVPFSSIGMSCPNSGKKYIIAAHCSVRKQLSTGGFQTETGWGGGTRITTKGNWGMYFDINISCEETPPPSTCSETAFAKGGSSNCFDQYATELGGASNRWGWTNGPLAEGSYTMTLWAGAGQCNTANGTNVGTLTVVYSGGSAVVTYNVNAPYSLEEVHLYVGNSYLPQILNGPNAGEYTIAPGQMPVVGENLAANSTTYSATINNLSGNIYVVAHASVKGFACPTGVL